MKSMRVELEYTPETIPPIHEGICESDALDRELVVGGQAVDGVETITSFVYGEPAAYEPLLSNLESVLEYDVTPATEGFFLYLRRELGSDGLSLLSSLSQDTVVVVPPIEIRSDRTIRLTLVGHPSGLEQLVSTVPDGIRLDVRWVSTDVTVNGSSVSDRQRTALQTAWDVGFYEVPREAGIEAVADELECAVSTASELLRRGEAHAVERVLEDRP
ncbi:HTH DNA binding domain-containing protein [Natronorubrum sediminis]|uniref:HTH DNA binding domain-containing protein n=1 Tax=Natronorubrum sediminis TaxID=640943 RepID=A0A1H6G0N1_9EURY|nr:helix-turn-helix domain-containing protein [Natronorubrum sediminis]SEH15833.1 HTH DNA binding domain-containing protein [Natronorubrum sediminis]